MELASRRFVARAELERLELVVPGAGRAQFRGSLVLLHDVLLVVEARKQGKGLVAEHVREPLFPLPVTMCWDASRDFVFSLTRTDRPVKLVAYCPRQDVKDDFVNYIQDAIVALTSRPSSSASSS